MEVDSKLIPILRESVEIVKMLFFRKLQADLLGKYGGAGRPFCNMLTGAVVNELFGTINPGEPFAGFVLEHQDQIQAELDRIGSDFADFRIALTDALRIQALCDYQEGVEGLPVLQRARDRSILLEERELPLPSNFLHLVRTLGKAAGIIVPPLPPVEDGGLSTKPN